MTTIAPVFILVIDFAPVAIKSNSLVQAKSIQYLDAILWRANHLWPPGGSSVQECENKAIHSVRLKRKKKSRFLFNVGLGEKKLWTFMFASWMCFGIITTFNSIRMFLLALECVVVLRSLNHEVTSFIYLFIYYNASVLQIIPCLCCLHLNLFICSLIGSSCNEALCLWLNLMTSISPKYI